MRARWHADDSQVRDATEPMLTEYGYSVLTAVDAADGLAKLEREGEKATPARC